MTNNYGDTEFYFFHKEGFIMFNFNNIGKKIKILAVVSAIIAGILWVSVGIKQCALAQKLGEYGANYLESGLFCIIVGPIISWVSCFVLYGFGQLVENSDKLVVLHTRDINQNEFDDLNSKTTEEIVDSILESTQPKTINKIKTEGVVDYVAISKAANKVIKNIAHKDLVVLARQHEDWYKDIKKMSIIELYDFVKNNRYDYQEEYIYLCCFEILNKIKQR